MFNFAKPTRLALMLLAGLTFVGCEASTEAVEIEMSYEAFAALDEDQRLEIDALEADGLLELTLVEDGAVADEFEVPEPVPGDPPPASDLDYEAPEQEQTPLMPIKPLGLQAPDLNDEADDDDQDESEDEGAMPIKPLGLQAPDLNDEDEDEDDDDQDENEDEDMPIKPLGYAGLEGGLAEIAPTYDPDALHPPVPAPVAPADQPYPNTVIPAS